MITIQQSSYINMQDNINLVFDCDKTRPPVDLEKYALDAEMALLSHLQTAFNLIDMGTD